MSDHKTYFRHKHKALFVSHDSLMKENIIVDNTMNDMGETRWTISIDPAKAEISHPDMLPIPKEFFLQQFEFVKDQILKSITD